MQALDPVTHGRNHALDLVVLAFGEHQAERQLAGLHAVGSSHRLGVVIQHHAGQQFLHLRGIHRVLGRDLIDLGHMVPGRAHAVNELAVVRQQQQTGGVLVQAPDGLHTGCRSAATLANRRG